MRLNSFAAFVGASVACVVLALRANAQEAPAATGPATQPADVELKILNARINRVTPELQKTFRGRMNMDGNPGVHLQLMLTLRDAALLPLGRDAVAIETFIDDTYQNLLSTGNQTTQWHSSVPVISDDGTQLLVPVQASRTPAEEAERIFVRGTITGRVTRGAAKTATGAMKLQVGTPFEVGPFKSTIRGISDSGPNSVNVTVSMSGDAAQIRNIRVLSRDGAVLAERIDPRGPDGSDRGSTFHLPIPSGNTDVVLEYSYAEQVEAVKIPFEAQVDIGQVKAGPIESQQKPGKVDGPRPWPPPRAEARPAGLAARRPWFRPATLPSETSPTGYTIKVNKPAVDLFSLTLGKPAPGEAQGVAWENEPSGNFRARGFTIARLMLSVPDSVILRVRPSDVEIARFSDDRTPELSTELAADPSVPIGSRLERDNLTVTTPDGQQALLTLPLQAAITPGATRFTLAGTVSALVGSGEKLHKQAGFDFKRGSSFKAGPFEITVKDTRMDAPLSLDTASHARRGAATLEVKGPIGRFRSIEASTIVNGVAVNRYEPTPFAPADEAVEDNNIESTKLVTLRFNEMGFQPMDVTIRYFEQVARVPLPFEIASPIGIGAASAAGPATAPASASAE